jgi:hypothetical protein
MLGSSWVMRIATLYAIGAAAVAFGFYAFWRNGIVSQNAFAIGGICIVSAAALQIVHDLWRRLRR